MLEVGRWLAASLCLLASCAGKSTATGGLGPDAGGTAPAVGGSSGAAGGAAGTGPAMVSGAGAGASAPGGATLGGSGPDSSAGLGGASNPGDAGSAGDGGFAEAGTSGSAGSDDERATYDTGGFSGGYNHLWIRRRTEDGQCHSLALLEPSNVRTLDIDVPERWGIEPGSTGGCTGGSDQLTGGVGWVRFTGSNGTCTIDFDFTLSFTASAGGSYDVHFAATDVPRPAGLATPDCR